MADNVAVTPGVGATIATDDVAGVQFQRVKLDIGGDGATSPVVAGNGLPTTAVGTIAHDAAATTVAPIIIGSVAALSAPTDVADGDAVRPWLTRNGSLSVRITGSAGGLVDADFTNGVDVDVTRASGQVAHDSAITGNPVRIGGRAVSADITAVATGDQTDLIADLVGKLVTMPYAINQLHWQAVTAAKTDTSDTAIKASAGAGLRNYITSLTVTNSHATVGTVVEVKDGSTVIHRGYAAPAGGGYAVTFPTPLKGTAATAVNVANITTGSNTYVSMSGYTGA